MAWNRIKLVRGIIHMWLISYLRARCTTRWSQLSCMENFCWYLLKVGLRIVSFKQGNTIHYLGLCASITIELAWIWKKLFPSPWCFFRLSARHHWSMNKFPTNIQGASRQLLHHSDASVHFAWDHANQSFIKVIRNNNTDTLFCLVLRAHLSNTNAWEQLHRS